MILITHFISSDKNKLYEKENININYIAKNWKDAMQYVGQEYDEWLAMGDDTCGIHEWVSGYSFWRILKN